MKGFLAKAKKTFNQPKVATNQPQQAHLSNLVLPQAGLKPKYTVPPVPHPSPHEYIGLLATRDGILLHPHRAKDPSCLRIPWGTNAKVEEVNAVGGELDWSEAVIVYGIIGILDLFSGPYLLVITSRAEVGHLFDPLHAVYGVKGASAIPLFDEERARMVLNTISSRNMALSRPSLIPSSTVDTIDTISSLSSTEYPSSMAESSQTIQTSRVQFASEEQIKVMTPAAQQEFDVNHDITPRPVSPALSSASTGSSDSAATSPVAKTVADRLSFWSRLSKRGTPLSPILYDDPADPVDEELPTPLASAVKPEVLDEIIRAGKEVPSEVLGSILEATAPPPASHEERHLELETKIIRECIREYTKGGMYFAYHFDITRSLQHKQELASKARKQQALLADLNAISEPALHDQPGTGLLEPQPTLPLWRRVDKQFWWNEWLSKPFVDAGHHSYVLPIMQGYYQIARFPVPEDIDASDNADAPLIDYVIASRRSRDRAGLRYQRRGIDDEAHVANFVETETIMRVERGGKANIFSYVQIRGSIPLFWTQIAYALKPPPVLASDRTHAQNLEAIKRHFGRTVPQYGPHTIVNLAEQTGKEGVITKSYREFATELASDDARYHEYDFHRETKGMKYENISTLIEAMERVFDHQGYFWLSDGTTLSTQKGVFRVNCIDCLDRTNVVQSAFARNVLNKQLGAVAFTRPSIEDRVEINSVFNDVWANNGDAISRAYAGTSALKGDFTR
ncbi:hypothetical protein HGRIS_012912 [Hohenbuehelia grisea]|uniref:SAC domain-containing protein n=1 Tax=Hohenbuehelia grisea TaxID=104357 RepID=A0ABR3ITY2_9AGAR